MSRHSRFTRLAAVAALVAGSAVLTLAGGAGPAGAAPLAAPADPVATVTPAPVTPAAPGTPTQVADAGTPSPPAAVQISLTPGEGVSPTSQPLSILLMLTVVTLAPAMLILITSFTRIVIVLGLTRNALNLNGVPPNQVLIGLALFLTVFVMGPVFSEANEEALQPYLKGAITQSEAFDRGMAPFRTFMLDQTRDSDLALFSKLSGKPAPRNADDIPTTTLIPAYVIGELRAAFLIGFIIFIPFLVIDLLAGATLMSMGMIMLPPVLISLPFKLLLFVVVDGWALVVQSLVKSFA